MRSARQPLAKLPHQARLTNPRFAHYEHDLSLAVLRALPAVPQKPHFVRAPHKRRETTRSPAESRDRAGAVSSAASTVALSEAPH